MAQWNAGSLLELSGKYWHTCTLHAGVKLEIFSQIDEDQVSARELAEQIGVDERGVAALLNALSAMGLLVKSGSRYANTPESWDLLVRHSPHYIGYMIMHHHHLVEPWSRLDEVVRVGHSISGKVVHDDDSRESFLMGMFNMAMAIAPRVSREIDLKGKTRFLDLGGGPGTYAIHFCLANPELNATVADLSTTRPFAEKTIARFDLSRRIEFMPCDYLNDPIEGTYDVVWLSHILHGEGPDECEMILQKAVSAMVEGGTLFIHEFILNNTSDGPLFPALFYLNMLINTQKGRAYTEKRLSEMMEEAGLHNIERLPFQGPTDSGILVGTK
ncbi:MAG: methyltransferase domain-containing protein [Deltaproteobacteria bacterium]|nr:methyltransferase domain-containing protein [Deltaproteobacteria bacterium]